MTIDRRFCMWAMLLLLTGCAASSPRSDETRAASARSERIDWELVAAVERRAMQRGTGVVWVRYPERTRYSQARRSDASSAPK